MTINIDGRVYYCSSEICKHAGISRATLFRWLHAGILPKYQKDRRGWLIFTTEDLNKFQAEAKRIDVQDTFARLNIQKNRYEKGV
jgi:predicted site-specific integrase-resolvase